MTYIKESILLFLLFLFLGPVYASDTLAIPPRYASFAMAYDIDQGLPITCVERVIKDHKGRLWLNPCAELDIQQNFNFYQYDGKKAYDISTPLPGDDTTSFFLLDITSNGMLYGINDRSTQLFFLDPDTHENILFSFDTDEGIVNVIHAEGDELFALISKKDNYLIYKIHPDKKELLGATAKAGSELFNSSSATYNAQTSFVKQKESLWFLNMKNTLIRFYITSRTIKKYAWNDLLDSEYRFSNDQNYHHLIRITHSENGNLIVFIKSFNKFFTFNPETEKLYEHQTLNHYLNSLDYNRLTKLSFFHDRAENIFCVLEYWADTWAERDLYKEHLFLLDKNGDIYDYNPILEKVKEIGRYDFNILKYIYGTDYKSNLYLASNGGFITLDIQADLPISTVLKNWSSRAIAPIGESKYMVLSDNGNIGIFDPIKKESAVVPKLNICNEPIAFFAFTNIIVKNPEEIWFPGRGKRLIAYNFNKQTCKQYDLGSDFVKFQFLNEQEVALTNDQNTLFIYNLEKEALVPYVCKGQPLQFGDAVNELYVDTKGILWVATLNGLWRIDTKNNSCEQLGESNGFSDNQFMCIHEQDNGDLIFGTLAGGLNFYDPVSQKVIKIVDQTDGLSNNTVVAILPDKEKDLWVATFDGLTVLSKNGEVLFELYEKDGLSHREFNRYSYYKTPEGKMIFGTIDGVNMIDPEKVKKEYLQKEELQIYLSEVNYYKKDKQIQLTSQLESLKPIILSPSKRYLKLSFALSSYIDPEKSSFYYFIEQGNKKIKEEEKVWMNIGYNSALTLADLPVGKLTIYIKGLNYKGQWTETPLAIPVIVRPFFYQTWWFYLLCTLPFLVIAFLWSRSLVLEKLRLEKEVKKRTQQIVQDKETIEQQAIKLKETDELKSRLFTNISHEFRTPLTIIMGMINQIEKQPKRFLKTGSTMIKKNGANLLNLINQILELQKLESGSLKLNMEQGDIIPFLRNIFEQFKTYAQSKEQHLEFISALDKLEMDFDQEKILRITSNLLSNAIKFTPKEGQVLFSVAIGKKADIKSEQCLMLSIRDTGPGIPKDQIPFIFDRYFQVTSESKTSNIGTGIGLSLTLELVNLLHGKIEVNSQEGYGTTFQVYLPITNKASAIDRMHLDKIQETIFGRSQSPTRKQNSLAEELPLALLVEDNADIAQYIQICLEGNFQLEIASNGEEGITKALELIPDVIVTDVMMPKKDGFELLENLKEDIRTSHIPIIMLTAKSDIASRLKGLKQGADEYLSKPFHEEELLIRMENLLKLRQKLQERYQNTIQQSELKAEAISPSKEDIFLDHLHSIFEAHMDDPKFEIEQLSKKLGLSQSQLRRKVKAITGRPLSIYLRSLRLQKARHLLLTSELPIKSIAYEVGFQTPTYFTSSYKEEFGENPRVTRQAN